MPLQVGKQQIVSRSSFTGRWLGQQRSLSSLTASVCDLLGVQRGQILLGEAPIQGADTDDRVERLLREWQEGPSPRQFASDVAVADEVGKQVLPSRRQNAFFQDGSENQNVHTVIHKSYTPRISAGVDHRQFFAQLGNPCHPEGSPAREAEQEYLLQNMVKGALWEAAEIAQKQGIGIAVRGTSLMAHMGIESGAPTKAQEIKNKTSKELDLLFCPDLQYAEVGAVVHYNPLKTIQWQYAAELKGEAFDAWLTSKAWPAFKDWLIKNRIARLHNHIKNKEVRERIVPQNDAGWETARKWFLSRVKEYREEDPEFRTGHYSQHVVIKGPFVHLKARPDEHLYGDHDLFVFTEPVYGLIREKDSLETQSALQDANSFQAQHGGIWYWAPQEEFHQNIKKTIMGAHSPPGGDPLVYLLPGYIATAAFYIPGTKPDERDKLVSAWSYPEATGWLKTTFSGKKLLEKRSA